MARGHASHGPADRRSAVARRLADVVDEAADKVARKVDEKRDQAQAKLDEKHRKVSDKLEEKRGKVLSKIERGQPDFRFKTEDGGAYEIWLRERPGSRKPRFSYDEIAAAAMHVVDTEGLDNLSMRRLATELGSGTMTLYHYLHTKDELLALLVDRVMGELVLPDEDFPDDWREALTAIAHRTRQVMERHPWVFDIAIDPGAGPNGVRHFDQSLRALRSLDATLPEKFDILAAVDEYTFGHCMHRRGDGPIVEDDEGWAAMTEYFLGLVAEGGFPQLEALVDELGAAELSQSLRECERDPARFDRNLNRVLDGIEANLPKRRRSQ